MATRSLRPPLAVALSVWRALFLREAVVRLARNRTEWLWLIVEPVAHIAFLAWLFVIGFRQKAIVGMDVSVFIMVGILAFFLPRNMMNRSIRVVDRSEALYMYRQVRPVDTVLSRAALESVLMCVVFAVVLGGAALLLLPVRIADPLGALAALGSLWLMGLGLALTLSVIGNLHSALGQVARMIRRPLYFFSAVIYPSAMVPPHLREWLLYNPLLHGVESLRVAFAPTYPVPHGVNLAYPVQFAVVLIFLGLALHVRFESYLTTK